MYWFKGSAKNDEKTNKHYSKKIYEQFKGERDFNPPCRLHLYTLMIRGAAISALTCLSQDSSSTNIYFPFSEPNSAALCDAW